MTDYISRQAAIERIDKAIDLHEMDGIVSGVLLAVRKSIEEQRAADVRENVKGKWIHEYDHEVEEVKFYPPGEGRFYAHCSNCGYYAEYEHDMTNYCPNCGADMRGGA